MAILNILKIHKKIFVAILVLLIVSVPIDASARKVTSKHKYIARFVYNFMSHVDFPTNSGDKINICIIGDNAITPHLSHLVSSKDNSSLLISSKYIDDNLNSCHVVYIDEYVKEDESRALLKTQDSKILTIGNIKGFANRGGVVEFFLRKNKVELKINVSQMNRNEIHINDSLLSISDTVNNAE